MTATTPAAPPAHVVLDPTGFPMIWVKDLGAHLHFLPVTKYQFEHFLCERFSAAFDQGWYAQLLALNGRVSPRRIEAGNYWKAFLTGALPAEAATFAEWCGEADAGGKAVYQVPTPEEWFKAYQAFAGVKAVQPRALVAGQALAARD